MARGLALAAALVVSLLAVAGAGGAAAQQTPNRGGTVVFGPVREPFCLNPLLDRCRVGPHPYSWIRPKVLASALELARDESVRPVLVSRLPTIPRRPPFVLTYAIRPGARWSDGVPITARDFLFTHRVVRARLPDHIAHREVRSIRAVDARTVRVVLRSRTAYWSVLFAPVLPWHALVGEDLERIWSNTIDNPKTGRPIASGPFLVGSWERGRQLTLVRNPRYWGPHVSRLDGIVFRVCRDTCQPEEVLASLRDGAVDIAHDRDSTLVPQLRQIPGTTVRPMRSDGYEHLALNLGPRGHPALKNKLVRRALAYGIDRDAIVHDLFRTLDARYQPRHSVAFPSYSRYHQPNWRGYGYQPARARRLLEQAGCRRDSGGIYACAGQPLSFRLSTPATSLRERGLALIRDHLRAIGVEVRLSFVSGPAIAQVLSSGDFDVFAFAWFGGPPVGNANKGVYGCRGAQNYTGYCQRLVTRDLDQAERILDERQRARVLNRVDRQLARDVPVLPLYQIPFVIALRRDIRNVVLTPWNIFFNAEDWWLDD